MAIEHRPDVHLVCELPPGTTVKAFDGKLIACHPNHTPIFIGMGNNTPQSASLEPHHGINDKSDIGRVANIDVNESAEFTWPEPLAKGEG